MIFAQFRFIFYVKICNHFTHHSLITLLKCAHAAPLGWKETNFKSIWDLVHLWNGTKRGFRNGAKHSHIKCFKFIMRFIAIRNWMVLVMLNLPKKIGLVNANGMTKKFIIRFQRTSYELKCSKFYVPFRRKWRIFRAQMVKNHHFWATRKKTQILSPEYAMQMCCSE